MNGSSARWLAPVLLMLLTACGPSAELLRSWKNPEAEEVDFKLKKVLILAVTPEQQLRSGQRFEQELATDFVKYGIEAHSAKVLYGPQVYTKEQKDSLSFVFRADGFSHVLLLRLADARTTERYVPGTTQWVQVAHYNPYWNNYFYTYDQFVTPGYYEQITQFIWETNLYGISKEVMIYGSTSQAFAPASSEKVARDHSDQIVTDLIAKGLVQPVR